MAISRFGAIAAITAFMLISGAAFGQVNIEKLREEPPDGGISSDISVLFSTRSGNVDITQLSGNWRTDYVASSSTTFLILRGMYGWLSGDPFSNEGLAHLRHSHNVSGWIHAEAFGQIDYDKSRKLEFRSVGGAGVRFGLIERESVKLAWGTAYMIEYERYDLQPEDLHSERETSHRWSNYLSLRVPISDESALVWTAYVQPRFDDFGDLKTLSEGAVETALTDVLTLTVAARLRYDSAPPDGVVKRDTFFMTGLGIQF